MSPLEMVLSRLTNVRRSGNGWSACCPAHEDRLASLGIAEGRQVAVLLKCHAGCSYDAILTALGLTRADLLAASTAAPPPRGRVVAHYRYVDEAETLLYEVLRTEPKGFRQRRPDGRGGWIWNLNGVRRILYRLPELLAAPLEAHVLVCEGEKDVETARGLGFVATCNPGGTGGGWRAEYSEALRGRYVIIIPDNDPPGHKHAENVRVALADVAADVRIMPLPGLGKDLSDWTAAGGTADRLHKLISDRANDSGSALLEDAAREPLLAVEDGWRDPTALESGSAPRFPLEALPAVVRNAVADVARVVQVPLELPAAIVLGILTYCASRAAVVGIGGTHVEPLALYVAAFSPSGTRKSAVLGALLDPLYERQRQLFRDAAPEIRAAEERKQAAMVRLDRLRKSQASASDPADRARFADEAEALAREMPTVPAPPWLVVDDQTPEALAVTLEEQGGRVLLASAEGADLFAVAAGRNVRDGGDQATLYLHAYDGEPIDQRRIGRGRVVVDDPALSIVVTPQPIVLEKLRDRPELHHRGLLPRFVLLMAGDFAGMRRYDPGARPDARAREDYADALTRLLALPRFPSRAETPRLPIAGAALELWREYHDRVERDLGPGGLLAGVREWASKQAGRVARIAGALHFAATVGAGGRGADAITPATVAAAVEIGIWLEAEALRAYGAMQADPTIRLARKILEWLRRTGIARTSAREILTGLPRGGAPSAEAVAPAVALLVDFGWLRVVEPEPRSGPGRSRSAAYEVHPCLREAERAPQNTQNALPVLVEVNSADSAAPEALAEEQEWVL